MYSLYAATTRGVRPMTSNADVFIFWKTDPTHSHPKLVGKLLFTRGLLRSSGKEVKKLIFEQVESIKKKEVDQIQIGAPSSH